MSLDKAIAHGKEHRKPYRGAKAVDPSCRNHGTCEYCKSNRLHKYERQKPLEEEQKGSLLETEEEKYQKIYPQIKEDLHLLKRCEEINIDIPERFFLSPYANYGFGVALNRLTMRMPVIGLLSKDIYPASEFLKVRVRELSFSTAYDPKKVEDGAEYRAYRKSYEIFHKDFRNWLEEELQK